MKAFVVTHTHWDREWYTTFEIYRQRLSILLNQLVSIFESEDSFKHFYLDGQTVVIEDFVENDGTNEKLFELIKTKRIAIGPWYVLPDEFLISGESWIRNFLYSRRVARKFGLPLSEVAYLPDMFGHSAYTPTVLKGLGLNWAVVWRGVENVNGTSFVWRSPSGEEVNTVYLVHSYSNAAHWDWNEEKFKSRLLLEAKRLADRDPQNPPLLMNGTDHEMPRPDIGKILQQLSGREFEFVHTSLEEYVSQLKKPREECVGELRSPKHAPILKDVLSARIWEKMLQHEAEKLYLHYVEPLMAMARLHGKELSKESLWYGWRLVLQCHPHDSLCGCSIDEVHRNVQDRLRRALNHGKALMVRALLNTCGEVVDKLGVTVFNPLEREYDGLVGLNVRLPDGDWKLVDENSEEVECVIFPADHRVEQDLNPLIDFYSHRSTNSVFNEEDRRFKCLMKTKVDGMSFKQFTFVHGKRERAESFQPVFDVQKNGALRLRQNEEVLENLCYVEDIEDVGDEYNYSYVRKEKYDSKSCEAKIKTIIDTPFLKQTEASFSLKVPEQISEDRKTRSKRLVEIPFRCVYTFYREVKRVDVDMFFTNTAKDHRLSVVLPLQNITRLITDGYYGPVERKIEKFDGDYSSWSELPDNQFPMYWFVSLPEYSITITTKGLREVFMDETGLHITILRSVGWLSRSDLITRPGHAGPGFETLEAQGLGDHRASFSIIFHDEYDVNKIYEAIRSYQIPPIAVQGKFKKLPRKLDIEIRRGFISAFKPAEEKGVILRVFCPDGSTPEVQTLQRFVEVDLKEDLIEEKAKTESVRSWLIL